MQIEIKDAVRVEEVPEADRPGKRNGTLPKGFICRCRWWWLQGCEGGGD